MPAILEPEKLSDFFSGQVRKARRFYLDDLPLPDAPLAVVGGGHEFCSPDYVIRRNSFPYFSVELVVRGRGWLTLDGRSHQLEAGSVFYLRSWRFPAHHHRLPRPAREVLRRFHRAPRSQILAECGLVPGTIARVSSISELQDVFDNLIRDGLRTGASNVLCAVLSEYLMIKLTDLVMPPGTRPSPALATFQRCRQYITTHFRRLRSLEQIAGNARSTRRICAACSAASTTRPRTATSCA